MEWADRTLSEESRYRSALRIKVVSLAQLGRIEEARDWLRRVLELEPGLTVARFKASATYHSPQLLARYVEGLRKVGLPEE